MSNVTKFFIIFGIMSAFVLIMQLVAGASDCVVQRQVYTAGHYYSPVVLRQVVPAYYYSVGASIQEEALAERIAAKVLQRISAAERIKDQADAAKSIVSTKCATCHKQGTKAEREDGAPVFFDALGKLTATSEQRASMRTSAKLGAMPPSKELTDEEYLRLVEELKAPIENH